ncbi:aspartate/glutamate racemase family protein [Conexibacter woesei]|uniref:aspartate/glutamate racemase family protein n=1 Tax=Conexibacter woesei TaxID=191495 RepID=UPI00032139B6|nr:aspartate/glutamate racemase family protein [Conexibacter woesei]
MSAVVPEEVARNVAFLSDSGVWHVVSRNRPAFSCADAARKRKRLSHRGQEVGIPLCDELKTAVCVVEHEHGQEFVVLHCRGHQLLDDDKLAAVLGAAVRRMEPDELEQSFDLAYGLVTPFAFAERDDVRQVFDRTVIEPFFPPYTMMTNLGHHEYGVEFQPRELVGALPRSSVEDIARGEGQRVPVEHTLGILTGNGPESGRFLWSRIDECIRNHPDVPFRGDIGLPRVVVESVPEMGLSMELEERLSTVRPAVLDGVRRLCERGATVVGIACNTTQYFVDDIREVCEAHGAQFVSIVEATAAALADEGIERVVFLGIGAVSDFDRWSDFRRIAGEFAFDRPPDDLIDEIDDLAFLVKQRGIVSVTINPMRDIVRRAAASEDTVILVALTELSLLVASQRRSRRRFVDTLQILAEAMAGIYIQERIPLDVGPEAAQEESAAARVPDAGSG